jgi:hypothetical protein
MNLKKIIALICLFVLSLQVIPVQQIGGMLFNNQITEEIAHSSDCGKKFSVEKESDNYIIAFNHYNISALSLTNNHGIHAHTVLVKFHVEEVQTPPPNLV